MCRRLACSSGEGKMPVFSHRRAQYQYCNFSCTWRRTHPSYRSRDPDSCARYALWRLYVCNAGRLMATITYMGYSPSLLHVRRKPEGEKQFFNLLCSHSVSAPSGAADECSRHWGRLVFPALNAERAVLSERSLHFLDRCTYLLLVPVRSLPSTRHPASFSSDDLECSRCTSACSSSPRSCSAPEGQNISVNLSRVCTQSQHMSSQELDRVGQHIVHPANTL